MLLSIILLVVLSSCLSSKLPVVVDKRVSVVCPKEDPTLRLPDCVITDWEVWPEGKPLPFVEGAWVANREHYKECVNIIEVYRKSLEECRKEFQGGPQQ